MKRLLRITEVVLMLASVTAVVDASRVEAAPVSRPAFHAAWTPEHENAPDRRFADLARVNRKDRENRHRRMGRSLALRPGTTLHAAQCVS
jgi:hypothetical protein